MKGSTSEVILQNERLNLTSNLINAVKTAIRKPLIPERLEETELLNLWQDTEKQRLTEKRNWQSLVKSTTHTYISISQFHLDQKPQERRIMCKYVHSMSVFKFPPSENSNCTYEWISQNIFITRL